MDVTEWPQNIHEYHRMVTTAQANAMKLEELQKAAAAEQKAAEAEQKAAAAEPKAEPKAKEGEK